MSESIGPIEALGEVVLWVGDMDAMQEFYKTSPASTPMIHMMALE